MPKRVEGPRTGFPMPLIHSASKAALGKNMAALHADIEQNMKAAESKNLLRRSWLFHEAVAAGMTFPEAWEVAGVSSSVGQIWARRVVKLAGRLKKGLPTSKTGRMLKAAHSCMNDTRSGPNRAEEPCR